MKNIINILKIISDNISNILFPVKCALCKLDGEYLCLGCENNLELNHKKINDWIYAKYKYQNTNLKKLEYKIKYNHHPKLAEKMGEYSHEYVIKNMNDIRKNNSMNIFLIPIPISKDRLKQRGYNQTEYIAKGINNMNPNFKVLNILERRNTKRLKDIYGVDNRSEEVRYSMSVGVSVLDGGEAAAITNFNINNLNIKNKNNIFILIDDITTTGATFYEARRALIEYGIMGKNIYAYSLAH